MSILGVLLMSITTTTAQVLNQESVKWSCGDSASDYADLIADRNTCGVRRYRCNITWPDCQPRVDLIGCSDHVVASLTLIREKWGDGTFRFLRAQIDSPRGQRLTLGHVREHMWVTSDRRTEDDGAPTIEVVQFGEHDCLPDYGMPDAIAAAGVAMRDPRIVEWVQQLPTFSGRGLRRNLPARRPSEIDDTDVYLSGVANAEAAATCGPWTAIVYALACGLWAAMDTW
jgi:hypothetical protein